LAKTAPLKPEDAFARSYVDRLILEKLTELDAVVKLSDVADQLSDQGLGLAVVRSLLASNPERFAYHDRRWIPSTRLSTAGRPLATIVFEILNNFGGPMSTDLLVREVARSYVGTPEMAEVAVRRLLDRDPQFVESKGHDGADYSGLTKWGFNASDEPRARALALNQVDEGTFAEVEKKVEAIDFRAPGAIAQAVKLAAPVSLKALGAVIWARLNATDPRGYLLYDAREFYRQVTSVPGFILGPDFTLYPETEAKRWVMTATKLADRIAPTVDLEDAAPIEIKAEDIERLAAKVAASPVSYTATKLLEEAYEITPGTKTFPDDLANMLAALKARPELQWVGGDRFQKVGLAPDWITTVPEPFVFVPSGVLNEEGEPVDVELTDEGLSTTLRKLLSHPLATDVLDEDVQPAPKTMPEQVRLVLKSIHRELGTFPMSQLPTGWLDPQPGVQELIVADPAGRELQIWVNLETRLMYNWLEWWFEQPVESGGVFTLTKTPRPNVLDFAWLDQPDPVVYISSQRMEELRTIGADGEGKSTLDLLTEVMAHWPKGADYLTVLAELNVVRRSSRRLVASLLSSYQCFYQRSGSPVWHFDPKKVEQGFDKSKKKFIKK
jgi:hypothetical protein